MAAIPLSDIRKLSVTERIQLVEEIWDTVVDEAADGTPPTDKHLPVTDAQRQELDARLDAAKRDPGTGSRWPEVKARLLRGA